MKYAVITGGSRGLGRALVNELSSDGWIVKEFSRSGKGSNHIDGDMANIEEMSEAFHNYLDQLVGVKELLFIHNAAVLEPIKKFEDVTVEEFKRNSVINVDTPLVLFQSILKKFRGSSCKKTLVNISSGAAVKGHAGWSLYCLGKAAIENFFNALYLEELHEKHPFTIINYDPGIMDTQMQEEIRSADKRSFPELERFKSFKRDGNLSDPVAVAKDIIYLLSHGSDRVRYRFPFRDQL